MSAAPHLLPDLNAATAENTRLNEQFSAANARIAELEAQLRMEIGRSDRTLARERTESGKDTARLNWLDTYGEGCVRGTDVPKWAVESPDESIRTLREAIDKAMGAAR